MTRGLTLGKYAPLHKGHQLVIETALAEMDEVLVIIYDAPETTDVPLSIRSGWIRKLYPMVRIIEAPDGPTEVGGTPEIKRKHEDYIINKLGITEISHFYSSEFYGEHMSVALGAVNRLVDPDRSAVPVSGTNIRRDPYAYRAYIEPVVYRDLITNVVFLGAPSTGKTTISEEMAKEFNTVWMPEYGREYWEKNQVSRRLSQDQLLEIAEGHLRREDQLLLEANRFLFCDTNAITTFMFSQYYHHAAPARLAELADACRSRYDVVFLCDTDIPYDDTWDRSGDTNRKAFQANIICDLADRKIAYITLRGDRKMRVETVRDVLRQYHKYGDRSTQDFTGR